MSMRSRKTDAPLSALAPAERETEGPPRACGELVNADFRAISGQAQTEICIHASMLLVSGRATSISNRHDKLTLISPHLITRYVSITDPKKGKLAYSLD